MTQRKGIGIYLIVFGLCWVVFSLFMLDGTAIPWIFFGVGMVIMVFGMWMVGCLGRQERILFIFFNYFPVLFILGGLSLLTVGSLKLINRTEDLVEALLMIFGGLCIIYVLIRIWKSWNWRFFNDINDLRNFLSWPIPERSGRTALLEYNGIADCLYAPTQKHTKTEAQFSVEAARFAGAAMDKIGQDEEINQINIWVEGKIPLRKGSRRREWKGVKLVLDKSNWRGPAIGDLSSLAYHNQEQYLSICSIEHVEKKEFPKWPKTEWGGPG